MAIGMVVRRGDGSILIDSTYKTLGLVDIVEHDITADATVAGYPYTFAGKNILIACYCETLEFAMASAINWGTSATVAFYFRSPIGLTTETVRFYVFANPVFGAETYGVKIFDPPTGECIFSNFAKPIRIEGVVPGNTSFVGTSGRIYAPIILTRYDDITYNNGVIWNHRSAFMQCAGSVISVNMRLMKTGGIRRIPVGTSYLAADVTDY